MRFTDVESGRKADRPELAKAQDRLSRNVAFLPTLRNSGVRFVAVDPPEANDLSVGLMARVAQSEREAISRRTREALAVAQSWGTRLGKPQMARQACAGQGRVGPHCGQRWR